MVGTWYPAHGQSITEAKSIGWRDFRKIVGIKFLDNVDCLEQCHIFHFWKQDTETIYARCWFPLDRDHGKTMQTYSVVSAFWVKYQLQSNGFDTAMSEQAIYDHYQHKKLCAAFFPCLHKCFLANNDLPAQLPAWQKWATKQTQEMWPVSKLARVFLEKWRSWLAEPALINEESNF